MMRSAQWQFARIFLAALSIAAFAVPKNVIAQDSQHLVSPSDLQKATVDASQSRQQNIDTLNSFFSSDQAQKALAIGPHEPAGSEESCRRSQRPGTGATRLPRPKSAERFRRREYVELDLLIILVCIAALILIIVAVR